MRVNVETEKAIRITSSLKEFNGTVEEWKAAFYEVWRYQMTFSFAHSIEVIDGHNGVFISLLIKPEDVDGARRMLNGLGYKVRQEYEDVIGIIPYQDGVDFDIAVVE